MADTELEAEWIKVRGAVSQEQISDPAVKRIDWSGKRAKARTGVKDRVRIISKLDPSKKESFTWP